MTGKKRLDVLLLERGLADSREKARGMIMAGQVYIDNQKADKPGTLLREDVIAEVRGGSLPYVSRGGLKLEKALQVFPVTLLHTVCLDIGASTGGFTDCMLQNGAARVYAVDVGYGQLAWKLRCDERVVNLERTNIRKLLPEQVPEPVDFFSVDVSFISLKLVLPVAAQFLRQGGEAVCLVKPQFEAGKSSVGKNGVVRDAGVHRAVVKEISGHAAFCGFSVQGLSFSPIKGPKGNIEYLLYLVKDTKEPGVTDEGIEDVIRESHLQLNGGAAT